MAEAALFTIAAKLLSTIASPAFKTAYERVQSIWGTTDDLEKLGETITSIQAVLLDAERKYNDSAAVKNWIRRVRNVLYDAEDLFDAVVTDDLLKQQRRKGKEHFNSVRDFFSKHNQIVFKDFISGKVKAIREDLSRIYQDMSQLGLIASFESENLSISGFRRGVETGSFVDSYDIIGRDDEKQRVVEFLYNEAYANRTVSLISIVGIGGMGKSTLAQLVYNDAKISSGFENRYWACISDIFDEKEVLGKIYQSVTGQGNYQNLSLDQVQSSIRKSIQRKGRFLLVIDDLWDENTSRGSKLRSILSIDNAEGSKIIITTRNLSVARAMGADVVLELQGLSKDASWALFRRYAFTKDQENDSNWISIGEKIVSKCSDVPLAIKSIASLLRVKNTIGEWKSLENEQLSKIQLSDNPIMDALRLSYNHLPSNLKNCFAYCSVFPKDRVIHKKEIEYFWIAQGYIMLKEGETLEMASNACFMELLRRSFFQVAFYDDRDNTEIIGCKMHDLVHDLAEDVAGEESCTVTAQGKKRSHNKIRHLCVDYVDGSMSIDNPFLLLNDDRLRSAFWTSSFIPKHVGEQFTKFGFLRALSLRNQRFLSVPSYIGEMKYLRYLNLAHNDFTHLPDSITKLVNLMVLDVTYCRKLRRLPRDIGGLASLRHLINIGCRDLICMPPTLGELTSLEKLSNFVVTKTYAVVDEEFCMLDALGRLNLRGSLTILFDKWNRDQVMFGRGNVPDTLEELEVQYYPSMWMGAWWRDINPASSMLPKLEHLCIEHAKHVKHLPPLRCLPCLRILHLHTLRSLEYIEEDEALSNTTPFFISLCTLEIVDMENLKGWSREPTNALIFPCLSELYISSCPLLTSLPIDAPHLKSMGLSFIRIEVLEQLVSRPCASGIEKIEIYKCFDLSNFSGLGLTSLRSLKFSYCETLSKVRVASDTVEEFSIVGCQKMKLWEESEDDEMSVDWPSFSHLRKLTLDPWQEESTRLPDCLQQLASLGKLQVQFD